MTRHRSGAEAITLAARHPRSLRAADPFCVRFGSKTDVTSPAWCHEQTSWHSSGCMNAFSMNAGRLSPIPTQRSARGERLSRFAGSLLIPMRVVVVKT